MMAEEVPTQIITRSRNSSMSHSRNSSAASNKDNVPADFVNTHKDTVRVDSDWSNHDQHSNAV